MIGKQTFNAFLEVGLPAIKKKYNTFMYGTPNRDFDDAGLKPYNQWTKDFKLIPWNSMGLFQEYLEMILQFGFVAYCFINKFLKIWF